jgi:hypothetical protein
MGFIIFLVLYVIGVMVQYVNVNVNHKKLIESSTDYDFIPWYQVAIAASWFGLFFMIIKGWLDKKFIKTKN